MWQRGWPSVVGSGVRPDGQPTWGEISNGRRVHGMCQRVSQWSGDTERAPAVEGHGKGSIAPSCIQLRGQPAQPTTHLQRLDRCCTGAIGDGIVDGGLSERDGVGEGAGELWCGASIKRARRRSRRELSSWRWPVVVVVSMEVRGVLWMGSSGGVGWRGSGSVLRRVEASVSEPVRMLKSPTTSTRSPAGMSEMRAEKSSKKSSTTLDDEGGGR